MRAKSLEEQVVETTEVRRHNGQCAYGPWYPLSSDRLYPSERDAIVSEIVEVSGTNTDESGRVEIDGATWIYRRVTARDPGCGGATGVFGSRHRERRWEMATQTTHDTALNQYLRSASTILASHGYLELAGYVHDAIEAINERDALNDRLKEVQERLRDIQFMASVAVEIAGGRTEEER